MSATLLEPMIPVKGGIYTATRLRKGGNPEESVTVTYMRPYSGVHIVRWSDGECYMAHLVSAETEPPHFRFFDEARAFPHERTVAPGGQYDAVIYSNKPKRPGQVSYVRYDVREAVHIVALGPLHYQAELVGSAAAPSFEFDETKDQVMVKK